MKLFLMVAFSFFSQFSFSSEKNGLECSIISQYRGEETIKLTISEEQLRDGLTRVIPIKNKFQSYFLKYTFEFLPAIKKPPTSELFSSGIYKLDRLSIITVTYNDDTKFAENGVSPIYSENFKLAFAHVMIPFSTEQIYMNIPDTLLGSSSIGHLTCTKN